MTDHITQATNTWQQRHPGAWLSLDFSKAFDSVSHEYLQDLFQYCSLPQPYTALILQCLRGRIRFLVGRDADKDHVLQRAGGLDKGTLSPPCFSIGRRQPYYGP